MIKLHQLSDPIGRSCYFTLSAASKVKTSLAMPDKPTLPIMDTRMLGAKLILEEALETIKALGFQVRLDKYNLYDTFVDISRISFMPYVNPDSSDEEAKQKRLLDVIDGCCDTAYVSAYTMLMCGVPDLPHFTEVCDANNRKFPEGVATLNEYGKYQKPEGWVGPDHARVIAECSK